MFITVNGNDYELATTLGVAKALEKKTNKTITNIMAEMSRIATVEEMIDMLKTSLKNKANSKQFEEDIFNDMDFVTIQNTCDTLLMNICFGGTPEEQERKIEDFPASAFRKNVIRKALNLPIQKATLLTLEKSSEQDTE